MALVNSLTVWGQVQPMKHVRRTDWTAMAIPLNANLRCHGAPALQFSYRTRLTRPPPDQNPHPYHLPQSPSPRLSRNKAVEGQAGSGRGAYPLGALRDLLARCK